MWSWFDELTSGVSVVSETVLEDTPLVYRRDAAFAPSFTNARLNALAIA